MRAIRPALLAAFLVVLGLSCRDDRQGKAPARGKKTRPPALVEVEPARPGKLSDRWTFLGNVRAGMQAELASGAAGEVRWVGPKEGARIKRGALLLRVDARVAKAKLRAAKARTLRANETLAQAKRELARLLRLTRKARSELELERAQSAVRVAQADIELLRAETQQAKAQLALHRVTAPFSGVITSRRVDPGDWVSVGTRVLDLVSTESLEVLVDVPPRLLQFVKPDTRAALTTSPTQKTIPARVAGIVRALDPVARTARIRLLPDVDLQTPKKRDALRAGAAVQVSFAVQRTGGVVVHRDALVVSPTVVRVIKIRDKKAQHIAVDVLATAGNQALVIAKAAPGQPARTLKAGDTVIVRGNERLRPGQPVRVAKPLAKPRASAP
jgi:RND family efflux transporter MFP subunit